MGIVSNILSVNGMTCAGCEMKIEKKLKSTNGINSVVASYSKGNVTVNYDDNIIDREQINAIITKLDYQVSGFTVLNKNSGGM